MRERIISSLAAIPIAVALVCWPGDVPAVVAWAVILTLAFGEYSVMCNRVGIPCRGWWGAVAIVLITIASQGRTDIPRWYEPLALAVVWLAIIIETGRPDRRPVGAIGSTLLGIAWIGGLGSFLIRLRYWHPSDGFSAFGIESGAWLVTGLLLIVWTVDTTAYLAGRAFGRTPLAPGISPGKTIEGAVAGFAGAALMGAAVSPLMSIPATEGLLIGAVVGVAAQIGDLFESAVKRELKVKDSGSGLPGHGGWLDRIDSLLFASATVSWWLLRVG